MLTKTDLKDLENTVLEIAKRAGAHILAIYTQGFTVTNKTDTTPLTEADLASHHLIKNALSLLDKDFPVLSEEEPISFAERKTWQTYWLIDPLDGTKEFINKNGEFSVNIALMHNNQPVLGVVHAPVLQKSYVASIGNGAKRFIHTNEIDCAETISTRTLAYPIRLTCSRSHTSEKVTSYMNKLGNYTAVLMGSSLKSCLVAEGTADVYPRFGKTSEWDTAACQIIVEEAGGVLRTLDNQPLSYNKKASTLNPEFIVIGDTDFDWFEPLKEYL